MTRVAFQGEPGAFSHEAALLSCGDDALCVPCRDFGTLFEAVENGSADLGVVPVENTIVGSVAENLDRLGASCLHAVAEVLVAVEHCLIIAPEDADVTYPLSVASHPVALSQCKDFFAAHPGIIQVPSEDTAGSVRALAEGRLEADAVIASQLAADRYGCVVLSAGIQDHAANFTRFLVIAAKPVLCTGLAKSSLMFTLPDRAGSLHGALGIFVERHIDLSRIESRPIPGRPWEYRFHVDVRNAPAAALQDAMAELRGRGIEVRVLGRYPEATGRKATAAGHSGADQPPGRTLPDPCSPVDRQYSAH